MREPIVVGTQVVYTRKFLKSCGMPATCSVWSERGTVISLESFGKRLVALIKWEGGKQIRTPTENLIATKDIGKESV
jgi:hypothetical protein